MSGRRSASGKSLSRKPTLNSRRAGNKGNAMSQAKGIRQVGFFDCPGGGQVVVEGNTAFIGHMRNPHGTSIVHVADPKNPKLLAKIAMPPGTHSHKARVGNGIMLTNHEVLGT